MLSYPHLSDLPTLLLQGYLRPTLGPPEYNLPSQDL